MAMELIDPSKEYTLTHPLGITFTMKHWTIAMQDQADSECFSTKDGKPWYDQSHERELKIELTVKSWDGINIDGKPAECTTANKRALPVGVVGWLIRDVDERAGLRMPDSEKKT